MNVYANDTNLNLFIVLKTTYSLTTIKIKLNHTKNYLVHSSKQKEIEGLKNYNEFEL